MKKSHKIALLALLAVTLMFALIKSDLNSSEPINPDFVTFKTAGTELQIPYRTVEKLTSEYSQADLPDWSQMDPDLDGYEGTRTLKLYEYINTMNPSPEPKRIIVAVMDSGFDIEHPGLKDNVWNNEAEINGTPGVDDDNNGFVDDFHGWNFLGKAQSLNLEMTREYSRLKKEGVSPDDPYYQKVTAEYKEKKKEDEDTYDYIKTLVKEVDEAVAALKEKDYTTDPKKLMEISETLTGKYKDAAEKILGVYMLVGLGPDEVKKAEKDYEERINILYDLSFEPSSVIGDNPDKLDEKNYGDNDVTVKGSAHGTHVAGIIGSTKNGIGQAPFVQLMFLRVVPAEGDERDKDIANGIRYAVDNGADIINLSAGKYFARNADYVTDAIKYAESKGVLFVVAAGNEGTNIEATVNYPPKFIREGTDIKYFSNVLCVGASTWMKSWNTEKDPNNLARKYDLAASFSNYSNKVVDLFAPGVQINSTVPEGKYQRMGGTSMASPNAAGVAAIIKGYFPALTASDIKKILTETVRKYDGLEVKQRESRTKVLFSNLSKTGGVIDAMNAFKMAENYTR